MTYYKQKKQKKSRHYRKSLLAFIDIIGFKKKVRKSLRFSEEADAIYELLQVHHRTAQIINEGKTAPWVEMTKLKANSFSDNIVISLPRMNDTVFNSFIHVVTYFQWETIDYYAFLRGAIVFGDICHTQELIFGPAFIQAYKMERKAAVWPRVVIDPQLIDLLSEQNRQHVFQFMLSKDVNGLPFVDYLRYIFLSKVVEESNRTNMLPWELSPDFVFRQHRSAVWSALAEPRLGRRVVSGLHSLSIYHNDCIDRICQEFQNSDYFPTIDEETKTRYICILQKDKIDLGEFFERYQWVL
jgi:hypothetical protein